MDPGEMKIREKLIKIPLDSPRETEWCAVGEKTVVVGPDFFEEDGVNVNVNSKHNAATLAEFSFLSSNVDKSHQGGLFGSIKMERHIILPTKHPPTKFSGSFDFYLW